MGFLDFLGEVAGSMAAKAQVLQNYKKEYEEMSDNNLKREYNKLKEETQSSWCSQEKKDRFSAVKMVLRDRGYLQ